MPQKILELRSSRKFFATAMGYKEAIRTEIQAQLHFLSTLNPRNLPEVVTASNDLIPDLKALEIRKRGKHLRAYFRWCEKLQIFQVIYLASMPLIGIEGYERTLFPKIYEVYKDSNWENKAKTP